MPSIPGAWGSFHPSQKKIDFGVSGDNIVIPGVASKIIRVQQLFFVVSAAHNLKFKHGSTDFVGAMKMQPAGSFVLDYSGKAWFVCGRGEDFIINTSVTTQVSGRVYYTQKR